MFFASALSGVQLEPLYCASEVLSANLAFWPCHSSSSCGIRSLARNLLAYCANTCQKEELGCSRFSRCKVEGSGCAERIFADLFSCGHSSLRQAVMCDYTCASVQALSSGFEKNRHTEQKANTTENLSCSREVVSSRNCPSLAGLCCSTQH